MIFPLSDLVTPATLDQIRANMVATLKKLGIPADQWRTTGSLSSILTALSNTVANFSTLIAQAIAGQFLNLATGGWLTLLAYYVYGVSRVEATFASGNLTLTNALGGVFNVPPGGAIFKNTSTGQTYTNTSAIALGPLGSSTAAQTIAIQATASGSDGGALVGAVNEIVSPPMFGVTPSNTSPIVGLDQQSDESLRAACLQKLGSLSVRGPSGAYEYFATHNPDGTPLLNSSGAPVNINRVSVSPNSSTGQVVVTLASPQGTPTPDDVAAASANMLRLARPSGVTLTVQSAVPIPYTAALVAYVKNVPGVSVTTLQTTAEKAISDFLAVYDIGGMILPQPASGSGVQQGLFGTAIDGVISEAVAANGSFVVDIEGLTDMAMSGAQVAVNQTTLTVRLVTSAVS